MVQNKNSDGRQNSYQNHFFFFLQETNISWESVSQVCVFLFFSRTKSLSTTYCLEMHTCMFSVWYVPMHLCGVVLVCGSLVTENVWNKVFTIKSTRTGSYYNTWTLKYLYSICLINILKKNQQKNMSHAVATKTARHIYWGHSMFHFYILFQRFCQPVSKFLGELFCQQC